MTIQTRELPWHLTVLRHHEDHADERNDRGVDGAEKQKAENNSNHDTEGGAKPMERLRPRHNVRQGSAACPLCDR